MISVFQKRKEGGWKSQSSPNYSLNPEHGGFQENNIKQLGYGHQRGKVIKMPGVDF